MAEPSQRELIVELIVARLERDETALRKQFTAQRECARHIVVESLLPETLASDIHRCFPDSRLMRRLSSFRERKYTFKGLDEVPPLLRDTTFAFQDPRVVACVERITGIARQRPDPTLYAGGLTLMARGDYLNPHIDNSHDGTRRYYRTLNLLYYVSPAWREDFGGNLELWDEAVRRRVTVASLFNKLVVMETNPSAWHSVSPVVQDGARCCVSNYYFSEDSPLGAPYFNVTSFSAPPGQPVRRALARLDGIARNLLRTVVRGGLGRTDLYKPKS